MPRFGQGITVVSERSPMVLAHEAAHDHQLTHSSTPFHSKTAGAKAKLVESSIEDSSTPETPLISDLCEI